MNSFQFKGVKGIMTRTKKENMTGIETEGVISFLIILCGVGFISH